MKLKLGILAVMGAFAAAQAFAACPDNALQVAINNYLVAATPKADTSKTLANIDEIVVACPAQPYVLKAAAMTYATIPSADAPTAIKRLARTRELFRQMWVNLKGSNPPVSVMGANNTPTIFGFDDLYNLEQQVRNLLFSAEQMTGELAPEDMPIGKGAPMRACESSDFTDAQHAYFWLKDKDHTGAFNLLDRIAQYCTAEIDSGRYTQILSHRARSLVASAKRAAGKPETLDKLKRAKADSDRYIAIRKKHDYAYWSESEARELNALFIKAGGAPPKEDWFKPALIANPSTLEFIAYALDTAWEEDSKVGISGRYQTYRGVIASAYSLAQNSGQPTVARKLLWNAAKAHGDGRIRGPGNAALKAPPSFLYNWIDPDFVPAPTPAPAPATPAAPATPQ